MASINVTSGYCRAKSHVDCKYAKSVEFPAWFINFRKFNHDSPFVVSLLVKGFGIHKDAKN